MKSTYTRRSALLHTAKGALGVFAAASVGSLLLPGCKKGCADEKSPAAKNDANQNASCPNQESLGEQEKQIRTSLNYVDASTVQGRTCDNCKLYTKETPGAVCGGCKVVPGPIHPKGHCTAWIHLM